MNTEKSVSDLMKLISDSGPEIHGEVLEFVSGLFLAGSTVVLIEYEMEHQKHCEDKDCDKENPIAVAEGLIESLRKDLIHNIRLNAELNDLDLREDKEPTPNEKLVKDVLAEIARNDRGS